MQTSHTSLALAEALSSEKKAKRQARAAEMSLRELQQHVAASADARSVAAQGQHFQDSAADAASDVIKQVKLEAACEISRAKQQAADEVRRVRVEGALAVAAALAKQQASAQEIERLSALERELSRALGDLLAQSAQATVSEKQAKVDAAAFKVAAERAAADHSQELARARAAVEASEKRAAAAELAADRVALAAAAAAAAAAATASAANPDAASCEHQGSPLSTQSRVRSLAPPQSSHAPLTVSAVYRLTLSDSIDLFSNMNSSKAAASARLSARVTAAMLEDMMQQMRNDEHRLLKGRAP
jgi:hypothetical protein